MSRGNDEGGATLGAEAVTRGDFRVAGLGAVTNSASTYATERFHHGSVAHDGYLFVLGGCRVEVPEGNCAAPDLLSDVQSAPILPDGSLGAFTEVGQLPGGRYTFGAATYNGYLFLSGGGTPGYSSDVFVARLQGASLGAWVQTTSLPAVRLAHVMVAQAGHLYVIGGSGVASVVRAPIHADGMIGDWVDSGALSSPRGWFGAAAHLDKLYAVAGWDTFAIAAVAEIEMARIRSDGSLEPFAVIGALPTPRSGHSAFAWNSHLYSVGGWSSDFAPCQVAPLHADGTLGPWVDGPNLQRSRHVSAVAAGHVYVTGGFGLDNLPSASTLIAPVAGSSPAIGGTGGWQAGVTLPSARQHAAAVIHGRSLYLLGGCTQGDLGGTCTAYSNDVLVAPIQLDGALGPWSTAANTFVNARERLGALVHRGHLYVLGGADGATIFGDTQYAALDVNGMPGPFQTSPHTFTSRSSPAFVLAGDVLYAIGGRDSPTSLSRTVEMARIAADGSVGAWSVAGQFSAPGRRELAAAAYQGRLYLFGGWDGASLLTAVEVAPILPDGSLGPFQAGTPLSRPAATASATLRDGVAYVVGSNTDSGAGVQYASIGADGLPGQWTESPMSPARMRHAVAEADGRLYVLGGHDRTSLRDDVQVGSLQVPAAIGRYSTLFDLQAASDVTCLAVSGARQQPGLLGLAYRTAPEGPGAPFGPLIQLGQVRPPAAIPIEEDAVRYLWVSATLDESRSATGPELMRRELSQITLSYAGEPCPPTRYQYVVGCGCDAGGSPGVLAVLVVLFALGQPRPVAAAFRHPRPTATRPA